jgi:hypothetical protein
MDKMRLFISMTVAAALVLSASHIAHAQLSQPNMEAALQDLYAARQAILNADQHHDHGGHAGAATQYIDSAIQQVNEGIEFYNEHGP